MVCDHCGGKIDELRIVRREGRMLFVCLACWRELTRPRSMELDPKAPDNSEEKTWPPRTARP